MKANELRIGNLVKHKNHEKPFKVSIIDTTETSFSTNIEPIPLTEEWLVKLGFVTDIQNSGSGWYKKVYYTDCNISAEVMVININHISGRCSIYDIDTENSPAMTGKVIKYVHTLQNLYFALTGEELVCQ